MLNKIDQKESIFFESTVKIKEQKSSSEEFRATLNKIIKDGEKQNKNSTFQNSDLDISSAKSAFIAYAKVRVYEDSLKEIEKNQINKLFNIIDSNNRYR